MKMNIYMTYRLLLTKKVSTSEKFGICSEVHTMGLVGLLDGSRNTRASDVVTTA